MAFFAALVYRFPSRKIFVVGITGTKGKTSVVEIINAILQEAGYKTALISTLRFKLGNASFKNKLKMTMPGRFFVQKFLSQAVKRDCRYVLLEMTSQAVLQFRHKFIELDAMIFTNLAPEHIESHGSFEKYREAKLEFFKALKKSKKKQKITIINGDDKNAEHFLRFKSGESRVYGLKDCNYKLTNYGVDFEFGNQFFSSKLMGEFNVYNILAAMTFVRSQAVDWKTIKDALRKFTGIPGRVEFINENQDFKIVVDYAHTPESLEKLYKIFQASRKICVLGAAGGGRDKWKRSEMGKVASNNCDEIILTNEDPYDENPKEIINDVAKGIQSPFKYKMILNRRDAIHEALKMAQPGDTVLITGKGTDPYIMGSKGVKIKWDDREVVREELKKLRGV
ncbi:Mur ligase family protein [Patescibacteria group bacterium]